MGFFDKIKGQLRSVIEWNNPGPEDLFIKWTEDGDEIKNASKLIVGPGQGLIFVYEGQIEAVRYEEGIVNLETDNIPFWTTISKFMQGFKSEHKVGIYFFKQTLIQNQKWGTPSVIKYDDPKYKFPVGLRAFGNYSFRIADAQSFFKDIVGSNASFSLNDFRTLMGSKILQPLADFLAESKYSYAEIDSNREEIAKGVIAKIAPDFTGMGFEIKDFRIEGTSFDEDTMRRINRIADMTAEAQAASAVGLNFAQMQQLEALKAAAANPGGMAGMGVGMGAGMGFGQMMAGAMGQPQAAPAAPAAEDPVEKLAKLKKMLDGGLISAEEYEAKKQQILGAM